LEHNVSRRFFLKPDCPLRAHITAPPLIDIVGGDTAKPICTRSATFLHRLVLPARSMGLRPALT
jgi:hypothetical protein